MKEEKIAKIKQSFKEKMPKIKQKKFQKLRKN